jgi:hypothetical protein
MDEMFGEGRGASIFAWHGIGAQNVCEWMDEYL